MKQAYISTHLADAQTAGIRFSSAFALAPVSITTMSAPSAANH